MSKPSEMENKFLEAEAKIDAKYEKFDPKRLTERSKAIYSVKVPTLGEVSFGVLTFNDIMQIEQESKTITERGVRYIYAMLKKAYPDLSLEDVKAWDSNAVAELTLRLQKAGFFQQAPM